MGVYLAGGFQRIPSILHTIEGHEYQSISCARVTIKSKTSDHVTQLTFARDVIAQIRQSRKYRKPERGEKHQVTESHLRDNQLVTLTILIDHSPSR